MEPDQDTQPSSPSTKNDFVGYDKIEESSSKWALSDSDLKKFKQTKWAVTEKVHGANFCLIVEADGATIIPANRRQVIALGDEFFGHKDLVERIRPNILEAYRLLKELKPNVLRGFFYGELFGGIYPHPDVSKNEKVQAVQTGIFYSPNIEFAAFDIAYEAEVGQKRQFLDFEAACSIFEKSKVFYMTPLFVGKYEQAIDYSPAFESTVSRRLGYPKIPSHNNKAEGVVVRPMKEILVPSKSGLVRAVIKNKIPEFREDKRFHEAVRWATDAKSALQGAPETPLGDTLFYEALPLITEQRLENAISKFGRPSKTDQQRLRALFDLFYRDIMDQLTDDNAELMVELRQNAVQFADLEKRVKTEASVLFKEHFCLK